MTFSCGGVVTLISDANDGDNKVIATPIGDTHAADELEQVVVEYNPEE